MSIKKLLTLLSVTSLTTSANAEPKTWDDDSKGIKVFILAGQSNMVGYGKVEEGGNPAWEKGGDAPKEIKGGLGCLREMAINNDRYPEYDFTSLLAEPGKPESSAWKNRKHVKVWWRNGHSGKHGGEISKGDLGPPFQGANAGWFGPEFGFGQIIGDHYRNDDVLIIKTAWGGHSLAKDFRPPTAVVRRGGEVGASFDEIFRQTRECLDKLGEEFPEWKGRGYQIAGFGWHQGFSDRVSREQSVEYKDNLSDFIADVRKGFGNPELPFVIASTGMAAGGGVERPPYKGYSEVERAQLWVADDARPDNVLSTDTRPFWKPEDKSPSSMGYHWNHSGYSYFMVGKALGDDMVKLLGK